MLLACGAALASHPTISKEAAGGEAQLREFERRLLGAAHASEHARQRMAVATRAARARSARRRQARCKRVMGKRARGLETRPALVRKCRRLARRAARRAATKRRSQARAAAAGPASAVGQWTTGPFSIPVMGIHAALLPTGKVLWFSYPQNPTVPGDGNARNEATAYLWNPTTGQTKEVPPPGRTNIWCAGQTFTKDGRLVVFGGNLAFSGGGYDFKGLKKVYTFNPFDETWTEQPQMRHGRWYPTGVLLPDGRIPIKQGLDETGLDPGDNGQNENEEIEIFTPSPDMNGRGTIDLLGATGGAGAPPNGDYYPHMFVMPSGKILIAGPDPGDSWLLRNPGPGNVFAWDDIPNLPTDRVWGTGVLVPSLDPATASDAAMVIGGSPGSSGTSISVATALAYDESAGGGWQSRPSMEVGRGHHNTVLLPDGSMVTIGGGVGIRGGDQWAADEDQKQVELWNPANGEWTLGPAQQEKRAYHSTALLLPDGRVVSAGDDVNGGTNVDTAEVYSPPYLFKGARPAIGAAPHYARVGTSFDVDASAGVTRAALVAPGATTHANDMHQRYVPLTVSQRAGGVTLGLTSDADVAVPGYYMLFLLNAQGVPSVAKWVQVIGALDPVPPCRCTGDPGGSGGPGSCSACKPPPPPPPPPPPTGPGPKLGVKVAAKLKLAKVFKRGLQVRVSCDERCNVRLGLVLGGKQVRKAGFARSARAKTLMTKRFTLTKAGSKVATLKFSSRAKRRLKRLRKVILSVRVAATDLDGKSSSKRKRVVLTR